MTPKPTRHPPITRKFLLRIRRDLNLYLTSLSPRTPLLLILLFLLSLLLLHHLLQPILPHTHTTHGTLTLPTSPCFCPPPVTPALFTRALLHDASFIARATHLITTPTAHIFRITSLYHGPPRAAAYPLHIPPALAHGCASPHRTNVRAQVWLIVGGALSPTSDRAASQLTSAQALHTRCGARKPQAGLALLFPFHTLSRDVADVLAQDAAVDDWWRSRVAWVEFADALARASNATRRAVRAGGDGRGDGKGEGDGEEWWLSDGVSVVAACQDRSETLIPAMESWMAADGVAEVVLVDWASSPSIRSVLPDALLHSSRLTLVEVTGQSDWVLTRAYNLAARVAAHNTLLKLDCDTYINRTFLQSHPLPRNAFYAGDWRPLQASQAHLLHTNGLLLAHRDDFLAIGGYDERITTYGWDDSDLAERLSRIRTPHHLRVDTLRHLPHAAALRVARQKHHSLLPSHNPHAAAVEIQRNRLLLTRFNLPPWRASSLHTQWNVASAQPPTKASNAHGIFLAATAANDVTAASALVSDADALDVAKRSIRLILHRYGVQLLPKTLTLPFYKALIEKAAFPARYAEVVLSLRGGCMSRLLAQTSSQHATTSLAVDDPEDANFVAPPKPYVDWRLQALWRFPDAECPCKFSAVFDSQNAEVIPAWIDSANPIRAALPISDAYPTVDVVSVLKSFRTASNEKKLSEELIRWINMSRPSSEKEMKSQILMEELACDVNPFQTSESRRKAIRNLLRQLVPTANVQEGVVSSLEDEKPTILDGDLLSEDKWALLVGETFAERVKAHFAAPEMHRMSAAWGITGAISGRIHHRLDHRACALSIAMQYSAREHNNSEVGVRVSTETKEVVSTIAKRVDRLFVGCHASPAEFLDAYPELALILAGLFSSKTCM